MAEKVATLDEETFWTRWRTAVFHPIQLIVPPVVLVLWLGQQAGVVADTPLWLLALLFLSAQFGTSIVYTLWPDDSCTFWQMVVRAGVELTAITLIIYACGWGPMLAIGYCFGAANAIRASGSRATRPAIAWAVLGMLGGGIAIATGLAPTLISETLMQGLGVIAGVGVVIVIWFLGFAAKEKERLEEEVRQRDLRFEALVQHGSDIITVFDVEGTVLYASPSFERVLAPRTEASQTLLGRDIVHPDDVGRAAPFFEHLRATPSEVSWTELRLRDRDGVWRWFQIGVTNLLDDPSVRGMVANMREITERKDFEEELSHQAFHDALTGLPNRAAFIDRLDSVFARGRGTPAGALVAVLFTDLDRFKLVNDSLGHAAGDRMLVEVAARLRNCVRPGDVVARLGGDEFTVLLEGVHSAADAYRVADRIGAALHAPVRVGGRELVVTTSIGVALANVAADSPSNLLRNADLAMYLAKERGRGRWEVFDPESAPRVEQRLETESELWRAIERRELVVYFQPEVSLSGGGVVALEALVRWEHPERGLLLPAAFVPLAEESSLIVAIDRYVLDVACRQASEWRHAGRDVLISVNLSPRFIRQLEAAQDVASILANAGLAATALQLEITERTALADEEHTVETIRRLRDLGVRVAIDDFGTGYSSLEYLKRFPVDVLKLDRTFVEGLDTLPEDAAIVQAVITMGHALGMSITAEGVERLEQAVQLRSLGCDTAQGFHFARPLSPDHVEELFAAGEPLVDRTVLPFPGRSA